PEIDFAFGGSFLVTINTTRKEFTLTAPLGMTLPDGNTELHLPDAPGGKPLFGGLGEETGRMYALFEGAGYVSMFGFEWQDSFAFELSIEGILFYIPEVEIALPSPTGGDPLLVFASGGAFLLSFEGIVGRFNLDLESNFPEWTKMTIDASFELHINTFGRDLHLEMPVFIERPSWLPEKFFVSGAPDGYAHFQFSGGTDSEKATAKIHQTDPR